MDGTFTIDDRDYTRPYLLLHGGGGPATMTGFADLLGRRTRSRVLTPTHPGFAGTTRPAELSSTRALAAAYGKLLDDLDLADVTLIGSSFGGWLAAEIAALGSPRVAELVIVDGIGLEVDDHPPTDVRGLSGAELLKLSFYDPGKAPPGAADAGPDIQALIAYAGPAMTDPTLRERLATLRLPVRVIWGEGDGIVEPDYGRAYAAAIPGATFTLLPKVGHLAPVEAPDELLDALTTSR